VVAFGPAALACAPVGAVPQWPSSSIDDAQRHWLHFAPQHSMGPVDHPSGGLPLPAHGHQVVSASACFTG